jgi:NAD(P)-dependent dehydrogenase (short-subunit alcohol dehydrogenase family)
VRVNLLLPGPDRHLARPAGVEDQPARERVKIPARRQGTAWQVAYGALYLLSDEASYVTGQTLIVDGGLTTAPRA